MKSTVEEVNSSIMGTSLALPHDVVCIDIVFVA